MPLVTEKRFEKMTWKALVISLGDPCKVCHCKLSQRLNIKFTEKPSFSSNMPLQLLPWTTTTIKL